MPSEMQTGASVTLLTGGSDRPYVFGLTTSLISNGVVLDLIGSDELDFREFRRESEITFLNLRGSSNPKVNPAAKLARLLRYYIKLIHYAATAKPEIFHILWNNKFETFDRTLLMFYYKLLRKKIVLTVHNVNMRKRDAGDTVLNRVTLRVQYRLADHLFVHTEKMKTELGDDFGVHPSHITVIPFGINNSLPNTSIESSEARRKLGLSGDRRTILFFGRITPYKGLDCLIAGFQELLKRQENYRLIIAGRVDRCDKYWQELRAPIEIDVRNGSIVIKDSFIPDDEVEVYFKAADVLVLPYRDIYQSGVLFTGQYFGIPIVAADVGAFAEDVVGDRTGFLFQTGDAKNLADTIERYFESDLYARLSMHRIKIRAYAAERHSWTAVAQMTRDVYSRMTQGLTKNEVTNKSRGARRNSRFNEGEGELGEDALANRFRRWWTSF